MEMEESTPQGLRSGAQAHRRLAKGDSAARGADAPVGSLSPALTQKLVVTGSVELSADDVNRTTVAVRADIRRRGGMMVADRQTGVRYGVRSELQARLPPAELDPFIAWLGTQGNVESTNLSATDVSREYFDQELRMRTLRVTLDRLEKLLTDRNNVPLADVLNVEREMTRVRGEIEQLEGQHRYLADRAALATLNISISPRGQVPVGEPSEKFIVMARGLALHFLDEGVRHQNRLGTGVALLWGRRFDLALDILPGRGLDDRSILLNIGGGFYSDFLGAGRRRFGNPFLGLRVGAGSLNNRSTLLYGAEVGVEIVRLKYLLADVTGRAVGLYYNKSPTGSDITLQCALGVGVPF